MLTIGFDAKRYFLNRTGLGNYSRDLIRILETQFPENKYIKYTPKLAKSSTEPPQSIKLPQGKINSLLPGLWRNRRIVDDLKRDSVDIFHGLSGEIPSGLKQAGIKSVVTIHDLIFLRFPELYKPLDRWIYNKKAQHAVAHADKIIAISEQTKRDILHYYPCDPSKIEVIYQVCHPAFKVEHTEAQKEALRKEYNLPKEFLLNVGSIEPRKNAFQLVKAIEGLTIPLIIIGKPTAYAAEIKTYVKEKGMENQVRFLEGFCMEELATIYSMASIFLYPSRFEGFGIPIIEALYSETPVITNKSGVFPEAAGPDSVYISPESTTEIKDAILSLWNDEAKRKAMAKAGIQYAQRFNDDQIAEQLMNCYRSL
ncbi:glycosyltransferase family 4 protein [Sphingobacterium lactis]|uniref:glycosyltransferase family 4 protein n=1 Tax=Sphingobacterium lactis TaxID=797291 RepID=UPI003F7F25E3